MFLHKDLFQVLTRYGEEIIFTVEITDGNGEIGKSKMAAKINSAPTGGSCSVTPTRLVVFETVSITCNNWTDDNNIVDYTFYGE